MTTSATVRKAIQDGVLEVRDYARRNGKAALARRDWDGHAAGLAPRSIDPEEYTLYREAFAETARMSAALLGDYGTE